MSGGTRSLDLYPLAEFALKHPRGDVAIVNLADPERWVLEQVLPGVGGRTLATNGHSDIVRCAHLDTNVSRFEESFQKPKAKCAHSPMSHGCAGPGFRRRRPSFIVAENEFAVSNRRARLSLVVKMAESACGSFEWRARELEAGFGSVLAGMHACHAAEFTLNSRRNPQRNAKGGSLSAAGRIFYLIKIRAARGFISDLAGFALDHLSFLFVPSLVTL